MKKTGLIIAALCMSTWNVPALAAHDDVKRLRDDDLRAVSDHRYRDRDRDRHDVRDHRYRDRHHKNRGHGRDHRKHRNHRDRHDSHDVSRLLFGLTLGTPLIRYDHYGRYDRGYDRHHRHYRGCGHNWNRHNDRRGHWPRHW